MKFYSSSFSALSLGAILSLSIFTVAVSVEAIKLNNINAKSESNEDSNLQAQAPKCGKRTTAATTTARTTTESAGAAKRNLDKLEQLCVDEGGRVIVYAGGDTVDQQDNTKKAFENRFPRVKMDIIVDYSKFHDGRIDLQLLEGRLVPDVVQLQTLQDFPIWRDKGVLLPYKPPGWASVYDGAKDPNGYFTGIYFISFSNFVNRNLIPDPDDWPTEAGDYLKPELKGRLVMTFPNDDDAILFWLKQVVDKHGWDFVKALVKQNVTWVRGSQEPYDATQRNDFYACPAACGDMNNPSYGNATILLPKQDPFVTWPQTAAIFKDAQRPSCAKLYMSWQLDYNTQTKINGWTWGSRRDVPPPKGYRNIFDYPGQTDPYSFGRWMTDRGQVERFKTKVTLIVGEVKGAPSPGPVGLYQDRALPH